MSGGFVENPFADPFADPAIDQVTSAPTASVTITATAPTINNNVNPAANSAAAAANTNTTNNNNNNNAGNINFKQAASTTKVAGSATSVTTSTAINIDMQNELERRQQELEIKAAELAAREEALRATGDFRRQHNWPPLPSFCPCKPCFFQDISVDIQPEFQKTVTLGYNLWIGFVFTLLMNLLGSLAIMIKAIEGAGEIFSMGLTSFIFFVPLTYMTWFRPLYKAFKNDSSFNFMIFFMVFAMQTFFTCYWSLGITSTCGLFLALRNPGGTVLTLFMYFTTLCWIAYSAASVLYLLKVHSIYRSSGASIAKARNEFAEGIIRNQYVQQTVATAARQTVNQQFANATGANAANKNSTGVRY